MAAVASGLLVLLLAGAIIYKRSTDPLRARESYDAGDRLLKVARYQQAILSFDQAVALKPDFAGAYFLRGKAYVANSEIERAIADFSKVIELSPRDTQALVARGAAYLEKKDYKAAISDATKAAAIDPNLASAHNLRGMAIRAQGDPRAALADFDRAVELAPSEDNYYQRAATYQILGEHRKAVADFDQVIAFRPDGPPAYFARAESRRAMGDIQGAKQDHQRGRVLDGR
ncbi:MAG: hypothetical protein DMG59_16270 [Acidobacteria bacterium]|nr:MAG: hypothetical protein DMG59_16270 [Acidobacteriota bacterium]